MSFCTQCGAELKPGNNFCIKCGTPVSGPPASVEEELGQASVESGFIPVIAREAVQPSSMPPEDKPSASKKPLIIVLICVVVVAIIAGVVLFFLFSGGDEPSEEESAQIEEVQPSGNEEAAATNESESATNNEELEVTLHSEEEARTSSNASAGDDSGYMLPDSNSRYYSEAELTGMSDWELYIARNEIFARLGRGFNNADLRSYFGRQPWYHQTKTPEEFDADLSVLNDYERKNSELIKSIEQSRGSSYLY